MLTSKQLNNKITAFGKTTAAMREELQVILANAAAHAYVHGDVTYYDRAFAGASGINRKRAARFVRDYGFASLDAASGTYRLNKTARDKADFANGDEVVEYLMNDVRAWYADEETMADIAKELDAAARLKALASQIRAAANGDSKTYTDVKLDGKELNEAMAALKDAVTAAHEKHVARHTEQLAQAA